MNQSLSWQAVSRFTAIPLLHLSVTEPQKAHGEFYLNREVSTPSLFFS